MQYRFYLGLNATPRNLSTYGVKRRPSATTTYPTLAASCEKPRNGEASVREKEGHHSPPSRNLASDSRSFASRPRQRAHVPAYTASLPTWSRKNFSVRYHKQLTLETWTPFDCAVVLNKWTETETDDDGAQRANYRLG